MSERSLVNLVNRHPARRMVVLASLTSALLLAIALPALAGGFQISVETPIDAQQNEAVLIARTFGCHQPADAKLSASAEGFVNGNRQSLPLELHSIGSGVYAIKKQWPSDGKWVLTITGKYNGMISSVLVELGPNGSVLPGTRLKEGYLKGENAKGARRTWAAADIDEALQLPAGATSRISTEHEDSESYPFSPITWLFAGMGASAFTVVLVRRGRRHHSHPAPGPRKDTSQQR